MSKEKDYTAYQYKIRQQKELEQNNELFFLKENANLNNSIIKKIHRNEVEPIISEYEWLKSMPSYIKYMFGIYFIIDNKEYLGGVVIYSEEYVNNRGVWDKYGFDNKIILLSRGVCLWWTPKNTASFFIKRTFNWLKENTSFEVITATVDPLAGEVGIIYQSLNFKYVGLMDGNYDKNGNELKRLKIIINGKKYSTRTIRKKIGTIKKEEVLKHFPEASFQYELRKRRYFYFIKNKRTHNKNLKNYIKPYPKKKDYINLLQNTNGLIYRITNLVNGKIYIGQTSKRLEERISNYKKDIGKTITYINRAFNKYGFENFKFEVIEKCKSMLELNEREIYWIEQYNSTNKEIGYNTELGGRNKLISDDTRQKMSELRKGVKQTDEHINKRKRFGNEHHCYGKTHSEEYKKNLSDKMKGEGSHWFGKTRDLSNMRDTKREKYGKKVCQYNMDTGEIIGPIYDSIGQAISETKITHGTINRHLKKQVKKYMSNISWMYFK